MVLSYTGGQRILRYPGALVADADPNNNPPNALNAGLLVKVPVLVGGDTVQWHDVVEGINQSNLTAEDPFSIASAERGLVALRINYPFQAAALSGFRHRVDGQGQPDYFAGNLDQVIEADDAAIQDPGTPDGAQLVAPDPLPGSDYGGAYGGVYGLGEQGAFATTVRPYRKVITANGVARREVFAVP
jgi:hypothetical protein